MNRDYDRSKGTFRLSAVITLSPGILDGMGEKIEVKQENVPRPPSVDEFSVECGRYSEGDRCVDKWYDVYVAKDVDFDYPYYDSKGDCQGDDPEFLWDEFVAEVTHFYEKRGFCVNEYDYADDCDDIRLEPDDDEGYCSKIAMDFKDQTYNW